MAAQDIEKAEQEAIQSSQGKLQEMEQQLDEMKNKVRMVIIIYLVALSYNEGELFHS